MTFCISNKSLLTYWIFFFFLLCVSDTWERAAKTEIYPQNWISDGGVLISRRRINLYFSNNGMSLTSGKLNDTRNSIWKHQWPDFVVQSILHYRNSSVFIEFHTGTPFKFFSTLLKWEDRLSVNCKYRKIFIFNSKKSTELPRNKISHSTYPSYSYPFTWKFHHETAWQLLIK